MFHHFTDAVIEIIQFSCQIVTGLVCPLWSMESDVDPADVIGHVLCHTNALRLR